VPGYPPQPGGVTASHIDADDNTVYIPAWGASLSAVDLHTGQTRWIWQPGHVDGDTAISGVFRSGSNGVVVTGDTIFATVWHYLARLGVPSQALLVAIDRLSGRELWRVPLPAIGAGTMIWAPPVVYQNLVIVHTLSAHTYAIDRTTQRIVWEFSIPEANLSTVAGPVLYGDVLYVDAGDSQIHAVRPGDGSLIWSAPFPTQADRELLATDKRIYVSIGTELYILDRRDGSTVTVVHQPHTYDALFSSGAAASNGLVFITVAGAAWCFDEP